jgi:hypothetical protein
VPAVSRGLVGLVVRLPDHGEDPAPRLGAALARSLQQGEMVGLEEVADPLGPLAHVDGAAVAAGRGLVDPLISHAPGQHRDDVALERDLLALGQQARLDGGVLGHVVEGDQVADAGAKSGGATTTHAGRTSICSSSLRRSR